MRTLLSTLRGVLVLTSLVLVTLIGAIPMVPVALLKLVWPIGPGRDRLRSLLLKICSHWARGINAVVFTLGGIKLHIQQQLADDPQGRYIVISNHQSWADILILIAALDPQFPFPRFFMKEQLRWLPFIGLACWALDYPFMKRHSRAAIQANPRLRHEDIQTVRRACAIFRHVPVSLVNYTEGTRATPAKRTQTQSPYQTLLPPKAGGTAFAVNAMHEVLDGLIDMSVAYVDTPEPNFWDLLCGRIPDVAVQLRYLTVPEKLATGDYSADADYRRQFKDWLNELWTDKDQAITAIQDPDQAQKRFQGTSRTKESS